MNAVRSAEQFGVALFAGGGLFAILAYLGGDHAAAVYLSAVELVGFAIIIAVDEFGGSQ